MKINIRTCPSCGNKHCSDEGIDNAYTCAKCKKAINNVPEKNYYVPDHQLAKLIEKYYTPTR